MPLARTFNGKAVVSTAFDGYVDRCLRWSDIQEYLPLMYGMAKSYDKVRVLEFGSRKGNSTLAFLAAAEMAGGHVWSNDINNITGDPEGMLPWFPNEYWTFTCGNNMNPAVQDRLPAECDVLFIDTSHEYEHTLEECRAFVPRVAPDGVALFHDTNLIGWPGYKWDSDVPPVRAALDDYCSETGLSWQNLPGIYGLGIIRP
jgi:cephalosporin hydroxylase